LIGGKPLAYFKQLIVVERKQRGEREIEREGEGESYPAITQGLNENGRKAACLDTVFQTINCCRESREKRETREGTRRKQRGEDSCNHGQLK
jgi:hypothetical protein